MSYKLIYLARRNPAVSREDWPRTWRSHAVFASQFPVIASSLAYIRYCNRAEAPQIEGLSTEHDGVAVLGAAELADLDGSGFGDEVRAQLDRDELRVFDRPVPEFAFYCTEEVIREGELGQAAVIRFQPRPSDVPAPAAAIRHVLNHPVHEPRPDFPFRLIAESWFASTDDAIAALTGGPPPAEGEVTLLTSVCHGWPRA